MPGASETNSDRLRRALDALQKPLAWERRQGCDDTVASGGLTAYAARWLAQAAEAAVEQCVLDQLARLAPEFEAYSAATQDQRAAILDRIEGGLTALRADIEARRDAWQEVARVRDEAIDARATGDLRAALTTPVQYVRGVGPRVAPLLAKLDVKTAYDLLLLFPRTHQDRRNPRTIASLRDDETAGVLVTIGAPPTSRRGRSVTIITAPAYDDTGEVELTWFNQPWLLERLDRGMKVYVIGRVERYGRTVKISVTEHEIIGREPDPLQIGRIVPVYPLTEGLAQYTVRRAVARAIESYAHGDYDPIPPALRERRSLPGLASAVRAVHFPADPEDYERARSRLAYHELLALQVELARRRRRVAEGSATPIRPPSSPLAELEAALPFEFTKAQRRASRRVLSDLAHRTPMSRLLHGDVGSGKTAVVMVALLAAARAGVQAALMVPTEILAQQHYLNLQRVLGPLGVEVALLVGSLSRRVREETRQLVNTGAVPVVVGTHALIQEGVEFKCLALAIVDEQHRFGVAQRSQLFQKGESPHFLVTTATPIPRTLALTVYGDLSVSVLDELPPGRQPIETRIASRARAYELVRRIVGATGQAYVVCPLIEKSEALDCQAATALAERLAAEELRGLRVSLLHGRQSADTRAATMRAFAAGECQVLVSTTVIEVGVDVPNARVMVVENAERFGLAQLHQLRGRIGRGTEKSYCCLISGTRGREARERLEILCRTTDGFRIAEEDLRIRGPGEFFGIKQSGLPDLRIANVLADVSLLEMARDDAVSIVRADPDLSAPEHADLRDEIARRAAARVEQAAAGRS